MEKLSLKRFVYHAYQYSQTYTVKIFEVFIRALNYLIINGTQMKENHVTSS